MDALYFMAMLIGIAALAVWSVLPEQGKMARWWWPFDMLEARPAQAEAAEEAGRRGAPGSPPEVSRGTMRQAGSNRTAEPLPPAAPARGMAPSWRDRRQATPLPGPTNRAGRHAS